MVVVTATAESGAPEVAWGDSFIYYDPDDSEANRKMPFATVVCSDYPGFDTESQLDREGVFRLNIAVGRAAYERLLDHPPSAHAERHADYDYAGFDTLIPHPIYAEQGWVSIVNPGPEDRGSGPPAAGRRVRPGPRSAPATASGREEVVERPEGDLETGRLTPAVSSEPDTLGDAVQIVYAVGLEDPRWPGRRDERQAAGRRSRCRSASNSTSSPMVELGSSG